MTREQWEALTEQQQWDQYLLIESEREDYEQRACIAECVERGYSDLCDDNVPTDNDYPAQAPPIVVVSACVCEMVRGATIILANNPPPSDAISPQ